MAEFQIDQFQTIDEIASYWFVLMQSPDSTPKDRYAFEVWKQENPANQQALSKIQMSDNFINQYLLDPALAQIGKQALEQTQQKSKSLWFKFSTIAATIIVAAGVIFFTTNLLVEKTSHVEIAKIETYKTQIGERSIITLSDASTVTLNTNSQIRVNFTAMRRNIKLLKGQVFFDVSKDPNRPFSVEAGNKRIVAIGTEFSVRFDKNKPVEVTLIEGRVAVDDINNNSRNDQLSQSTNKLSTLTSEKAIFLNPGEHLIAESEKSSKIIPIKNIYESTSWRDGKLIYRNEPIANVIEEMNRYNVQKMKLSHDPRLNDLKISGVFNTGQARSFSDALQQMHSLKVDKVAENQLILLWQE